MGGLIVSAVCFVYLVISFTVARKAYRRKYRKVYGSPAPRLYGGKHGHEKAHELAIKDGAEYLAMWPFYLSWGLVLRLISGPVPVETKIDQLQEDVDRWAAKQDRLLKVKDDPYAEAKYGPLDEEPAPPKRCPCGYIDECVIHCGDGAECHPTARSRQDKHGSPVCVGTEIIRTHHPEKYSEPYPVIGTQEIIYRPPSYPEIIRTYHPEAIQARTLDGKIVVDIPGCQCPECNPHHPGMTYDR